MNADGRPGPGRSRRIRRGDAAALIALAALAVLFVFVLGLMLRGLRP
jgi:hypothetical protein